MRIINAGPRSNLPPSEEKALKVFSKQRKSYEMSVYIGVVSVVLLASLALMFKLVICAFAAGYLTPQTIRCFNRARQMSQIQKLIEEGDASVVGVKDRDSFDVE